MAASTATRTRYDMFLKALIGATVMLFVICQLFVLTHIEYQFGQILLGIFIPIVLATLFGAFALGYRSASQ